MHLVGFIIRIYHDARSSECQTEHIVSRYIQKAYVSQLMAVSFVFVNSSSKNCSLNNKTDVKN